MLIRIDSNGWIPADCDRSIFHALLFLFSSPATRLAKSAAGRIVGVKLITLIDSLKSPPVLLKPSRRGVAYPLVAMGLDTDRMPGVEKVPLEPSGNESVWMSTEETAVVGLGFDWRRFGSASEAFWRGGSGGGGAERSLLSSTPDVPPPGATSSRAIFKRSDGEKKHHGRQRAADALGTPFSSSYNKKEGELERLHVPSAWCCEMRSRRAKLNHHLLLSRTGVSTLTVPLGNVGFYSEGCHKGNGGGMTKGGDPKSRLSGSLAAVVIVGCAGVSTAKDQSFADSIAWGKLDLRYNCLGGMHPVNYGTLRIIIEQLALRMSFSPKTIDLATHPPSTLLAPRLGAV